MASQNLNCVLLSGNLVRTPEVKAAGQTTVTVGSVAVNESRRNPDGTYGDIVHFFDFSIFGKNGEAFARFHEKGKPIMLQGKLVLDRWEGRNQEPKQKVKILVDKWFFNNLNREEPDTKSEPTPTLGDPDDDDVPF